MVTSELSTVIRVMTYFRIIPFCSCCKGGSHNKEIERGVSDLPSKFNGSPDGAVHVYKKVQVRL